MKSIEFVSAQNVKIEYEFASIIQRSASALIDAAAVILYIIVLLIVLNSTDAGDNLMVELILIKLPWIFYHPILEYLTQGQTLGKYALGIRVVTFTGERPGLREIFTRWIFKGHFLWIAFSFQSFFFGIGNLIVVGLIHIGLGAIGFMYASIAERKQRMGDVMANTVVIKNKSSIRYSLKDVLSIKSQANYTPEFPNVVRFTDEDMLLIKNTIQRVRAYPNPATKKFAIELANESARLIGLPETPKKRLQFLQTLLQDYVVLTR
ncbi:MAG: RDD family protein [Crocinitomicaceae bacterium]|nr:RDD family protein [Crocinitomicaceae bacterium]